MYLVYTPERVFRRFTPDGVLLSERTTNDSCALTDYGPVNAIGYQSKRGLLFLTFGEPDTFGPLDGRGALRSYGGGYSVSCTGAIPFGRPLGIAADNLDNVYVSEYFTGNVRIFRNDFVDLGKFRATPGVKPENLGTPSGITVDNKGQVFVVDTGSGNASRVAVFRTDGTFVRAFGSQGAGPGQLRNPGSIAVDGAGRCYVADDGNKRIAVFDVNGKWLGSYGSEGNSEGYFQSVTSMCLAPDGSILVLDTLRLRVIKIRIVERLLGS